MNVSSAKKCVELCFRSGITPFIWGHRGVGKSSAVLQLTEELSVRESKLPEYTGQVPWGFIDYRLGQCEASDIRGLPDRLNGRTAYLPPLDLPYGEYRALGVPDGEDPCFGENGSYEGGDLPKHPKYPDLDVVLNCGILFLDEINRADDDVLQATFQLVLDRRVGQYVLPTGWQIVCAGNYMQGYNVNAFNDPAFLDRFCHLNLTVTDQKYLAEWADYMNKYSASDRILQFVGFNDQHLIGDIDGEMGISIQPSPRSWEMVARVEKEYNSRQSFYGSGNYEYVVAGIIGQGLQSIYTRFNIAIDPKEIIEKGPKQLEKELSSMKRDALVGLMWGVISNVKNIKKTKNVVKNTIDFMRWMATREERDLAVVMGRQLMISEQDLGGAMLSNTELADIVSKLSNEKNTKLTWTDAIVNDKELQKMMSDVAYGKA